MATDLIWRAVEPDILDQRPGDAYFVEHYPSPVLSTHYKDHVATALPEASTR